MATRFIPVSIAIPAHLDHYTDTQLIARINSTIDTNTDKEPMVATPLDPGQIVIEVERAKNKRRSGAAARQRMATAGPRSTRRTVR